MQESLWAATLLSLPSSTKGVQLQVWPGSAGQCKGMGKQNQLAQRKLSLCLRREKCIPVPLRYKREVRGKILFPEEEIPNTTVDYSNWFHWDWQCAGEESPYIVLALSVIEPPHKMLFLFIYTYTIVCPPEKSSCFPPPKAAL